MLGSPRQQQRRRTYAPRDPEMSRSPLTLGLVPSRSSCTTFARVDGRGVVTTRRPPRGPGAPAHEGLVEGDFTAESSNALWLTDITEQRTGEGKLYLCAIKDVRSNRRVGYSIDSRMKSRLAVAPWTTSSPAAASTQRSRRLCGSLRPRQSVSITEDARRPDPPLDGRVDGPGRRRRRQNRDGRGQSRTGTRGVR